MKKASLVIANDCGPAHFAHIYNIPRVCLFARDANIGNWFYQTHNSVLLAPSSKNDIGTIKEEKVIKAVLNLFQN